MHSIDLEVCYLPNQGDPADSGVKAVVINRLVNHPTLGGQPSNFGLEIWLLVLETARNGHRFPGDVHRFLPLWSP